MGKSVVIADDAKVMRIILGDILKQHGFEIVGEASTGHDAVEKYKMLSPDIIFLDISMPELNGIDALEQILNYNRDANVIMCSALGQQAMVLKAIKIGAKDFVVKPFQPERILDAISKTAVAS